MIPVKKALSSSLGQKFIMALTGLLLVGFVISHLLGNLTLYSPAPTAFNTYAEKLHGLGLLILIAEVGLVLLFAVHIVTGIKLKKDYKTARPVGYRMWRSKASAKTISGGGGGEDSAVRLVDEAQPSNRSSRTMVFTGLFLLAFLVLHVWQFRFGPGVDAGYVTQLNGAEVRDLHRLVVEIFKNPLYVGFYVISMFTLGMHLRHAFWSAFQSLGLMFPRISKPIHGIALALAIILAAGFLFIPIWIYFGVPAAPAPAPGAFY